VIQEALEEKLKGKRRKKLTAELAKLDPKEERALAEESIHLDNEAWDEY